MPWPSNSAFCHLPCPEAMYTKLGTNECLHLGICVRMIFIPISSVRGACEGTSNDFSQVPGAGNCMNHKTLQNSFRLSC